MKKIITALTAFAFLAAGVGGASAATAYSSLADCSALPGDSSDWSTTPLADKLKTEGVSFDSIGTFSGCFTVTRTTTDGTKIMDLYDPSTLSMIHASA